MDINAGDTAWVLASAALVLLMTPGLAFFYGGMVRSKSVLNMLMMSFSTIGIVSLLWVLYGFSVAFGESTSSLWGGLGWVGMSDLGELVTVERCGPTASRWSSSPPSSSCSRSSRRP